MVGIRGALLAGLLLLLLPLPSARGACPADQCADPDGNCAARSECLVDPCAVVANPCVPPGSCAANHCGGCHAVCGEGEGSGGGPGLGDACDADSAACPKGAYCHRDAGACAGPGVCSAVPEMCTEDYAPVCGCDGGTHSNACAAHSKGVSVSYAGECKTETDGQPLLEEAAAEADAGEEEGAADACEDGPSADPALGCGEGRFCKLDAGACNNRAGVHFGICSPTGDACFALWDPVCGCDEKTYSNECEAHAAGASVSRAGECRPPSASAAVPGDGCEAGPGAGPAATCIEGAFCRTDDGSCGGTGACEAGPAWCTKEYVPVCGCDEETHSNECEARAAGVGVSYVGECNGDDSSDPEATGTAESLTTPPTETSGSSTATQPTDSEPFDYNVISSGNILSNPSFSLWTCGIFVLKSVFA